MTLSFISRLSGKLIVLTIVFVLIAEAVIFFPSAATFRKDWLRERAESASHLALALTGVPESYNRNMLADEFMDDTGISVVVTEIEGQSQLVLGSPPDTTEFEIIDLRGGASDLDLGGTLAAFSAKEGYFRVLADPPSGDFDSLEYLVPKAALQKAMEEYCHNILGLSILIAIITGILLYSALAFLIVRPIRKLARDVAAFHDDPTAAEPTGELSRRRDEIGDLERSFVDMKDGVKTSFEQRRRLADLGLAVSKINHDLRNVLTSAQLVSDRLAMDKDERVAKMGERLVRAVDRGVRIASDVLEYGQDGDEDVRLESLSLHDIAEEAANDTLTAFETVAFDNQIDRNISIKADADHTYRILQNIMRNAGQALANTPHAKITLTSRADKGLAFALIGDNGPGLPEKARGNLFTPFAGSTGRGRTGLGLTISKELAQSQGGDLSLINSGPTGTRFEVRFNQV